MEYLPAAFLDLTIAVCAIAGFAIAIRLQSKIRNLEAQLAITEAWLSRLAAGLGTAPRIAISPPIESSGPAVEPKTPVVEASHEPRPIVEPPPGIVPVIPPPTPAPDVRPSDRPRAARSIEEQLGVRWAVWIGGLALGLGGVFLVRYSIEQGLFGPGARIAAGTLFALALIGTGEWLRRRDVIPSLDGVPSAYIPGALTGAGTLTAFATIYAAHALYGMIGPASAFVALGVVAVVAMVVSALHGPGLAGLGLVGALTTPLLVSSANQQVWPVILYLAFAVGTAYGVARMRLWRWLALAASLGAFLWGAFFLVIELSGPASVMAYVVIQALLAGLFLVADPYRRTSDEDAVVDPFACLVLLGFAALAILAVSDSEAGSLRPLFAGVMTALLAGLAVRFAPAAAGSVWAGAIVAGTLLLWPIAAELAAEPRTVLHGSFGSPMTPAALITFLTFGTAASLGIAAASLWRVARAESLRLDILAWYLAAAVTPLATLVVAYGRVTAFDRSIPFALAAGVLSAGFTGATRWLDRSTERRDPTRLPIGVTASAALAALALGLTFALDEEMLTVAFALAALGTAFVAERTGVPALRHAVGALGLLVLGRLAWNPNIVTGSPGSWPILNWLLWGYGVPAVSFLLASRLLERSGRDGVTRFVESLAIAFAAFLVFFEIRHAIHGDIASPNFDHLEAGLLTTASLAFAVILARADLAPGDPVYRIGTSLFSGLALLIASFGLLIITNPLLGEEPVLGGTVINSLLAAYLLPAVMAGILTVFARRGWYPRAYAWSVATLTLILQLTWVVLEIRHLFHGPTIAWYLPTSEGEQWSYSLALLASGLVLLGLGTVTRSRYLRMASLVSLALAVLKVFIIDLASLEGIMRALSFIGLGITLIGIALVYQRLLVRSPTAVAS